MRQQFFLMISKALPLILTVLVVTSLFVPAVAATYDLDGYDDGTGTSNPTIIPKEALEFRIEHGYLKQFTIDGVGYLYRGANVWKIYTGREDFFTINADNDEKRMKLLEFMQKVDDACECQEVMGPLVGLLIYNAGFLCLMVTPYILTLIVPVMIGVTVLASVATKCMSDSNCLAFAARLRSIK